MEEKSGNPKDEPHPRRAHDENSTNGSTSVNREQTMRVMEVAALVVSLAATVTFFSLPTVFHFAFVSC